MVELWLYYSTCLCYNINMNLSLPLKKSDETERKTEKEKVEERREEVLSKGRKFKYPLQYARHRLVINTIIIAVAGVATLILAGWLALYKFQDMGDIMYRISRLIPVSVGNVDGKEVRFSDYLMTARSSLMTLDQQSGLDTKEEDRGAVINGYKRQALTQAEQLTYALKLGEELNLEVAQDEIDKAFEEHRKVGGTERSEESFLKVLNTNFGLSRDEYERMLYLSLMKSKVEQQIDTTANETVKKVEKLLVEYENDFTEVKEALGDSVEYGTTGGMIDIKNVDGGRSTIASTQKSGEVSDGFLSSNGDGYYFVKTISKTDTQVSYVSLYIRFSEFEKRFKEVQNAGLIKEYISIPELGGGEEQASEQQQ